MALITVGRTTTPSAFTYTGANDQLYLSDLITMSEAGYVQDIFVYCGAVNATGTFIFGLYDPSNHLLPGNGTSGGVSTPGQSYGVGKGWNSGTFPSSSYLFLPSGQQCHITVCCNQGLQWASDSGTGGHYYMTGATTPGQTFSGFSTDPYGNANTPQGYFRYWQVCSISSITSTPVAPGQSFTISGNSFTSGITSIDVNGTAVTSFTVNSDSTITATCPTGATTGPVHVHSNAGNATSASNLTVSSAHMFRTSAWATASSVYVDRTSVQTAASFVGVLRASTWTAGS